MPPGLHVGRRLFWRARALLIAASTLEAIVFLCENTATTAKSTGCGVDSLQLPVSPGR